MYAKTRLKTKNREKETNIRRLIDLFRAHKKRGLSFNNPLRNKMLWRTL